MRMRRRAYRVTGASSGWRRARAESRGVLGSSHLARSAGEEMIAGMRSWTEEIWGDEDEGWEEDEDEKEDDGEANERSDRKSAQRGRRGPKCSLAG